MREYKFFENVEHLYDDCKDVWVVNPEDLPKPERPLRKGEKQCEHCGKIMKAGRGRPKSYCPDCRDEVNKLRKKYQSLRSNDKNNKFTKLRDSLDYYEHQMMSDNINHYVHDMGAGAFPLEDDCPYDADASIMNNESNYYNDDSYNLVYNNNVADTYSLQEIAGDEHIFKLGSIEGQYDWVYGCAHDSYISEKANHKHVTGAFNYRFRKGKHNKRRRESDYFDKYKDSVKIREENGVSYSPLNWFVDNYVCPATIRLFDSSVDNNTDVVVDKDYADIYADYLIDDSIYCNSK